MPTYRTRLIRLVVALYPRSVRDRYGAEISELLIQSPKPGRDLADVVWCALIDRGASLTAPSVRPTIFRLTGLLAAPLMFGLALVTVTAFATAVLGVLIQLGLRVGYGVADAMYAASAASVVGAAVWLARPGRRGADIPAPQVVVPTAVALGGLAVASLPYVGEVLGETYSARLVALLCWYVAVLALGIGGAALVRRVTTRVAWTVLAVGAFVALELTCAMYMLLVHRVYGLPFSSVFGAYPILTIGIDPGLVGDPGRQMADALKGLPALLTVCTAFSLTFVVTRAQRTHLTPTPA